MNEIYESRTSIYYYKDTNVLKNKLNIQDKNKLFEVESRFVLARLYELRQNKNIGDFSIEHFLNIHKFLFDDIYPFAGLLRNENIAKDNFRFAEWEYIEQELKNLLAQLSYEAYLEGLNKDALAKKLAYYMAELNVLHPFREGNGRTIREFIRELALKNGYLLNMTSIDPKDMLQACIESVVNTEKLEKIIYKCLDSNLNEIY